MPGPGSWHNAMPSAARGVMDAFIAATAEIHGLTLVTRDVTGFEAVVRKIVNPWDEA